MEALNKIATIFTNMSTPLQATIVALLTALAIAFGAKPAIGMMRNFGDKKWVPGILDLVAVVLVAAVPVLFTVLLLFGNVFGSSAGTVFQ